MAAAIDEKFATGHLQDQYFRVSGQALVSDTPQHPPYRYRTPECPIRGLGRGMISHEQWAREAAAAPTVMGTPPLPRRHGHSSLSPPCRHGHSPSPALPSWALTCPQGPLAHRAHLPTRANEHARQAARATGSTTIHNITTLASNGLYLSTLPAHEGHPPTRATPPAHEGHPPTNTFDKHEPA